MAIPVQLQTRLGSFITSQAAKIETDGWQIAFRALDVACGRGAGRAHIITI